MKNMFLKTSLQILSLGMLILPHASTAALLNPHQQMLLKKIANPRTSTQAFSKYASTLLQMLEAGIKNGTINLALKEKDLDQIFDFMDRYGSKIRQHIVKIMVKQVNTISKATQLDTSIDDSAINSYLNKVGVTFAENRKKLTPWLAKALVDLQLNIQTGKINLHVTENYAANVANALGVLLKIALTDQLNLSVALDQDGKPAGKVAHTGNLNSSKNTDHKIKKQDKADKNNFLAQGMPKTVRQLIGFANYSNQ